MASSNSSGSPKRKSPHSGQRPNNSVQSNDLSHVRWITLILSILLVAFSVALRLQPSLIPKGSSLASDAFGKVGIVLFCIWLAWPAVEMVWRSPSGAALMAAFAMSVGLFLYQRKTIYITGPFLAIAAGLALLLGWVRKLKS
ncbi:MAG: hypothetical protein ABL921_01345 [Pirellula sp.]